MGEYLSVMEDRNLPVVSGAFATVLIIGAGTTGLALAQGFKKAGIACTIFEKHKSLNALPRDWNMGLHWGAVALQGVLSCELWDQIETVHVDPSKPVPEKDVLKFINSSNGELMSEVHVSKFYRLRRSKLRSLLDDDLDIRYNKALKDITMSRDGRTATVHFEDGTSSTGQFVIAADGARSTARQLLLGKKRGAIRRLPYAATFVHARFTAEQALYLRSFHPLYIAGIHPSGYFSFFGMHDAEDPDRPETWTFFFYISWKYSLEEQDRTSSWSNKQRLDQVKSFAKDFCDPWKSAFEWIPDDHQAWYMGLTDFDPGSDGHYWNNHGGRVTLAGDAAHAMTYQRGQGLNHSVTDAAKLVNAVTDAVSGLSSQATSISAYEDEMIARAGTEVRLSTVNTEMLHDWERVLASPVLTSGMKHKH
ncbi:hypothetical protein H112_08736 [Trichophyton rubrum D6]|uniref:FAD-binding domain-containing protein n=4 Tax=Trichophyton TaxID=5550 RepID=A0A178ES02_TRIRU|nr:uncharacterized protein TERG_01285 [Trichophyton rubrum CBS 118892]EZF09860.1 hypothetical protein H100_08758 [Trichophyton rubrum MR850]EZF36864.1 hypothetical protein H102_08717 [Trichophyton rubrum CBS 100081]EZF47460.1 hypothetical protein H103_08740 [Trichophyton rubrum CBS 288.86]EZF58117.1 hypothetical protein H104_08691 [Trichophyton rubrum CBS 289.86]EZF68723.1 hypothetical protein H105_08742 [Trichophyton soudanense CBS 452.61]EZF79418.1 hypothetical protein H110_08742 [Trichophy